MKCNKCGFELVEGWIFCGNCGAEIESSVDDFELEGTEPEVLDEGEDEVFAVAPDEDSPGPVPADQLLVPSFAVPQDVIQAYKNTWALVVGVSRYGEEDLPWVEADVERFQEILEFLEVAPSNTTVLTGGAATIANLTNTFDSFLRPRIQLGDRLIVLLAGKVIDRVVDTLEMEAFFVPHGADPASDTCLELQRIIALQNETPLHHCFVFVDAPCAGLLELGSAAGHVAESWKEAIAEPCCQFLVAAQEQQAIRTTKNGPSQFMESIAAGVGGQAEDLGDGIICGSELGRYVVRAVDERTSGSQTPVLRSVGGAGDFLFVPSRIPAGGSSIEMQSIEGELVVETDPPGARVFIDDLEVGRSPYVAELPRGRFTLKATLDGYLPHKMKLNLTGEGSKTCRIKLEPVPRNVLPPGLLPMGPDYDPTTELPLRVVREKDEAEMVLVPTGIFLMGFNLCEPDERPVHAVRLSSFYIDRYPITNKQFGQFMDQTGHEPPGSWLQPGFDGPRRPVVGVSWKDAAAYCKWAQILLPTEAQWEKAAKGPDRRLFAWGNREAAPELCRFTDSDTRGPAPVDAFPEATSFFGVEQMSGNVWEWCLDWYDPTFYSSSHRDNPIGPRQGRHKVLRGGAWNCPALQLRTSARLHRPPDVRSNDAGFRCAVNVPPRKKR